MEKEMAPHSSTLAWKILWMEEPGGLQSMGSLGVGHNWATSLSLFTFMHWRRKWQPTPVFLPGESHGQRSLVGCCLWGRTESDTTEATQQQQQQAWNNCSSDVSGNCYCNLWGRWARVSQHRPRPWRALLSSGKLSMFQSWRKRLVLWFCASSQGLVVIRPPAAQHD